MASRRRYLTQSELEEFANITITDTTEADDRINQAEEMIDQFVGYQERFLDGFIEGKATAGSATSLTLATEHQNVYYDDYLAYCEVEIIGGTGVGQHSPITASTYAGVITFDTMTTAPGSSSYYRVYQLAKFPRIKDSYFDGETGANKYFKYIPEMVKRATAAQVQYVIEMGDAFFSTDKSMMQSESIGNYSYTRGDGSGANSLLAPKAQLLLKGIINRKGVIILDT